MSEHDERLAAEIRRVLDEDVARLDETTRARLRQARRRALAEAAAHRGSRWWLMPAGAVAVSLLAVVLWSRQSEVAAPPTTAGDFELLTSQDSIELYRELDFYQWLQQERDHAG